MSGLNPSQIAIIKATVPILQTGGETLTKHFYNMMLTNYPEVKPLFNPANQESGKQPRALAYSVLCYARNIDALQNIGPLAAQIVNKHVSLRILPEHYPIVGTCLLKSIREVLGAEVATDDVIEAWGAAYGQLADILIDAEEKAYQTLESAEGGWRDARVFKISEKVPETPEITSFYLEPVDGKAVVKATPGQYIGLQVFVDGVEQRRNYSLSTTTDGKKYRISVKKIDAGKVSTYLHNLNINDTLNLYPPVGEFVYAESERPVVYISAGVGITPTLAMLETAKDAKRDVNFIHYARDSQSRPFYNHLQEVAKNNSNVKVHSHLTRENNGSRPTVDSITAQLSNIYGTNTNIDAYVLGPKGFMETVITGLKKHGVPQEQIKYEFFGPHEQMNF